jgi:hypothetical protein
MLPVPVYNTPVDGTYNTAVQLCVVNWLLDGIGELVSLCDWLQRSANINHRVPVAWVAMGFHMTCQYINISNSSTQYLPQHTPISHLWIAWTYSESPFCCAFKVTPIAVSGTESGSGKIEHRLWGTGILKLEEIHSVTKIIPKSEPKKWSGSR